MADLQPGWFSLAWQIVCAVIGGIGGMVSIWATANFARRRTVEQLSMRLAAIEQTLKHAPKHEDLTHLASRVGDLASRVANMEGQTERNNNLLEAIHDHLLNEK